MKILLFGPNGMLGRYIKCYFIDHGYSVVCIDRSIYDVMNDSFEKLDQIVAEISETNESCVAINCIGIIPQIAPSTREYIRVNSVFPHILASICDKFGVKLIHPTTDCVYSGDKGSYTPDDAHDEIGIYGISKSMGEPTNATVIRCSIIGEQINGGKSFLEWVRSNKDGTVNGYSNHYWNGVTCLQYAKIVETIIRDGLFYQGVRHVGSPQTVSKYEMVCMVSEIYNLNITVVPIKCDRPCDRTLELTNFTKIPPLYDQILEQSKTQLY